MNVVAILGRVTKEPEIRYSTGDKPTAVAKFNLAVDKWTGTQKGTVFVPCVAFGKTAETIEKYVSKGSQLGIYGELDTGNYEKDGKKVYTWNVKVAKLDFCSKSEKKDSGGPVEGFTRLDSDMEDIPF